MNHTRRRRRRCRVQCAKKQNEGEEERDQRSCAGPQLLTNPINGDIDCARASRSRKHREIYLLCNPLRAPRR